MSLRGIGTPALIALIAIVLVVGGTLYFNMRPEGEIMMGKGEDMMHDGEVMKDDGEKMMDEGDTMMKEGEKMMKGDGVMMEGGYQGDVLAQGDGGAILIDFNKADYEKAVASGKLVTLFFFANWCPICAEEFPKMEEAFRQLSGDVVGFRVNYNDTQTDAYEKQLASEFGVAYQHTKVFVKGGERILKAPDTWDTARFISEITNAL